MWLSLLLTALAAPQPLALAQDPSQEQDQEAPPPAWHSIEEATIEGRGWKELAAPYDRLPAKAEGVVRPPVWRLQRHSAGVAARFVTDSTEIRARWTLTSDQLAMDHMPATGVSGLDLYARDAEGQWRWVSVGRPTGKTTERVIVSGLDGAEREYLLYLPLYNGVESVEIGVTPEATFAAGPRRPRNLRKPIVFYGTSITQGACASRPGMTHSAILGRRFDRPVVNLGFSGNGRMDAELAPLLAEIDAALYVVDCLPNMGAALVTERAAPFVRQLRELRPRTPILLVEDRPFTNAYFRPERQEFHAANHAALRGAFEELLADEVEGLGYLEGNGLLGDDGDGAVDGSHPTDLGFVRQSDAFEPTLRELLAWRPTFRLPDDGLPRVLILGDSISMGYTPFVRDSLEGTAHVVRPMIDGDPGRPENCAGTTKGVEHLERWLAIAGGRWDVIHFNFGLHDLKRVKADTGRNSNDPNDPRQAEPELYEAQLRLIVRRLKEAGARLVFATTTPVPSGQLRPHRDPEDAVRYNRIAKRIMEEEGIPVNDLFAFVSANPDMIRPNDVHYSREGSQALSAEVTTMIRAALGD